ncbi:type I polyketide synthase [Natronohydrobacter thiooxidans]|uniref:type I polyketide synthase n=1 Tax=Natronohydrobacter thiooxidans TaxID=87172 RepID=UPI0008FF4E07|nr:type I polyketide synthase [Natronohydrobacter thiooxidans]
MSRDTDIAIIGMAAHLPGAESVATFWENLRAGRSSIRQLTEAELLAAGESPAKMRAANYVPYAAPLDGFAEFDPEAFGFSPKEAAILDPQHRQFLEVAWEAFENAGHPPRGFPGPVGVFAGCGMGSYFYFNICSNPHLVEDVGMFLLRHTGNDKDFLSTRVSHIFDLHGPSVNVQTACSTSLVAVHYAVQALLTGECDMALAGGVTIELPQGRGYLFKENEILSPDGECHAFDHRAQGTVFGSGAGAVVLRRLEDALADGDQIFAVIKGSAINNDGAQKAGYLAPSVEGQAKAVAEAHMVAGVEAETISYIECHGTGTYLGDPIEVAALTQAFDSEKRGFCRIGSVKTNIGHLDTAAGVASLIKVASALHHRELPPSLGYEAPNPAIDFEHSPFLVNDRLTPWQGDGPLRAGVNSLGVGGTNAHVVLEEAPAVAASEESDWPFQILTLSAKSKAALNDAARNLAAHLAAHPDQPLADVAYTLKEGRMAFDQRRVVVAESHEEAAQLLTEDAPRRVFSHTALDQPDIAFMFPGGGAQYAGMARELYETEPVFAEWMDRGLAYLEPKLDYDIRALWLPEPGQEAAAEAALKRPSVQLPLILITEVALAQMFIGWGVSPAVLVGHSMGENTAACLAGVMSFEDCIGLVLLRGQLFDTVPAGGMLSVPLSLDALQPYLGDDHDIASLNAPELTVISGPQAALEGLEAALRADEITPQRVAIDIAAHSRMLEPILERFRAYLRSIPLQAPQIPIISNRTGVELTPEQAMDPEYWVQHLRNTVRFGDCVQTLSTRKNRIYIEMGPGKALSSLARMHGAVPGQQVLSALRHPEEEIADDLYHLVVLARIWALGGTFDWGQIWGEARRRRVSLPTYPFQRQRFFIEPGQAAQADAPMLERLEDTRDWGTRLGWKPAYADCDLDVTRDLGTLSDTWLIFADETGIAAPVIAALRAAGQRVVELRAGDTFARKSDGLYTLAPEHGRDAYARLIAELVAAGIAPTRIAHFWLVTGRESFRPGSSFLHRNIEQGFYSLLFLAQAMQSESLPLPVHMTIVTNGAQALEGEALRHPEKAMIAGPARVGPREMPGLTCATLDIDASADTTALLEELCATPGNGTALIRKGKRYAQVLRALRLDARLPEMPQGAHWLITGGFGGIGLTLAEELITRFGAKITLLARTPLPARADWAAWQADHGPQEATTRRIMAIERLEALGGQIHVAVADVCNIDEMRAALTGAEAALGKPYGLIHAAGHIADAPLLAKSTGDIEEVFAPKLHGLQVIDALLPDGALQAMVLFASTSTLTAPVGQVDYVAANEYLNAFARSRVGGRTKVIALNWGIWAEAGMAAEAMAVRLGTTPSAPMTPCAMPLYDEMGFDPKGNRRLVKHITPADWIVDEHRTKDGAAVLPGTGVLDLAAQALRAQGEMGAFEIRDLYFFRALSVPGPREIRATLARTAEGYDFALRSDVMQGGAKGFVLNAQAQLGLIRDAAPAALDLGAIAARMGSPREGQGLTSPQEAHLNFGPRWRVLTRMAFGQGEGLAQLSLPAPYRGDLDAGHVLHPALMDLATGWAMELIPSYQGAHLWVPLSYGRLRVWGDLPGEVFSHVRLRPEPEPGFASFDITLAAPDGTVVAEITRFTIKRLEAGGFADAPPIRASELERDGPAQSTTLSPAEERLRDMLALGITPREGGEAFLRALASGVSPVVVSSIDPRALIAQVESESTRAGGDTKFERPDLGTDYVAPRNDVERMLAGFWAELLGIEQIGVEDNFFDLGGHSLIAVRLFAQVKKAFGVEFPISVLFEAPTISACAAMVAEVTGASLDGGAEVHEMPKRRRFTHLVPMHEGEGGPETPFFLVAGMFGNVLNLRHLATLLGRERPFYGLQARGLFGGEAPHDRIEDAARDYIAEMQQVQPHGPYLLGGFSGGGITAYEIARQLEAAGETVEMVVLLDTPLPARPSLTRQDKALIKLAEFRRKGPGYALEWWRARKEWQAHLAQGPAADSADAFHNAAIEAAFRQAVGAYKVQPWDGNLILFRPPLDKHWQVSGGAWVSAGKEYVFDDNEWRQFAPKLQVFEVPGDHDSMVLEPNVRALAAKLRTLMRAAPRRQEAAE